MADRSVLVRLRADISDFQRKFAAASATTSAFKKNLNDGGADIDRFSGRLRLLADAGLILGPALVPLGAAVIPALTGSIAALGSAAGGLGATLLAFNGLGDAMDAIDAAQLEPTAENLQAMRVELEKLGPAGAQFAKYLQSIAPEMTQLQMVARQGMFPGIEQGIESLMTRLPEVQEVIGRLSRGVGDLAAAAGDDLSSEEWQPFFDYVEMTARPTLERFGNTIGNVAQGLADMLVAFAPVTRDFTRGLEDMSEDFATWAAGLKESETFKDFLDYIRQSGPQALDLLGSLAETFIAIAEAAAPVGSVVLPVLTSLVKIIGAIANTPLGAGFLTAAVAIRTYNLAAKGALWTTTRLKGALGGLNGRQAAAGIGLIALSMTDLDDKAGLTNTTMLAMAGLMVGGPWGAAIGAGVGQVMDLKSAHDDLADSINRANDAAAHGTLSEQRHAYRALRDEVDGFSFSMNDLLGHHMEENAALAELRASMHSTGDASDLFAQGLGITARQLRVAAGAAEDFKGAIEDLNGWLDKREALRNYRDSIRDIAKGLKDGFGREDRENIDAMGRGIIQVATQIKDKSLRADFLAGARASMERLANHSGPKARAEIQNLIDKMDELGLTHPEPKIKPDTAEAEDKIRHIKHEFDIMDALASEPEVDVGGSAFHDLYAIDRQLDHLDGRKVTTNVVTIYTKMNKPHGPGSTTPGDTNQLFGDETPRTSSRGAPLAPRGSLATQNQGKADYFAAILKGSSEAGEGLAGLRDRLHDSQSALDKETRQRDRLRAKADEVSSGITSGLTNDLWATSGNVWAAGAGMTPFGALADRKAQAKRLIAAIRALKKKGITGAALAEILTNGGVDGAEYMAAQPAAALLGFQSDYASTQHLINQASQMGSIATGFPAAAAALTPGITELNQTVKHLTHQIQVLSEKHKHDNKKNSDDNAQKVAKNLDNLAGAAASRAH